MRLISMSSVKRHATYALGDGTFNNLYNGLDASSECEWEDDDFWYKNFQTLANSDILDTSCKILIKSLPMTEHSLNLSIKTTEQKEASSFRNPKSIPFPEIILKNE